MINKSNFKISSEIYPAEKEKENKKTVWEYYFARKIAFLIFPIFLKTKISANQISISAIIIGIIASILIAIGDFWLIIFGGILMQVWLILDKVDGLVARYKKIVSRFGEFLEEFGGSLVAVLFFSSIGTAASKFPGFLPSFFQWPSYIFIIFGITTSFFVIFRHLIFRHFESVFGKEKEAKNESYFGAGSFAVLYKIAIKFLGIYSLAQPIFILAVIFNFLGLYTLVYFIIQGLAMAASVGYFFYKASPK